MELKRNREESRKMANEKAIILVSYFYMFTGEFKLSQKLLETVIIIKKFFILFLLIKKIYYF